MPLNTHDDMPDSYHISGKLPMDLSNAVSDAIHAALEKGMAVDEASTLVACCAVDYWRSAFGAGALQPLFMSLIARDKEPMPEIT